MSGSVLRKSKYICLLKRNKIAAQSSNLRGKASEKNGVSKNSPSAL